MRQRSVLVLIGTLLLAGCGAGGSTLPAASVDGGGPRAAQSVDSAATKLVCFSGTTENTGFGGTCTLTPTGAVLSVARVVGSTAGVYINSTNNMKHRPLSTIDTMSFDVSGDPLTFSPHFIIPYTTDDGATTYHAYIGAYYCNNNGHVDIHNASCAIGTEARSSSYINWAEFVAANPTGRLNGIPYIVADHPGHTWTISNVRMSK